VHAFSRELYDCEEVAEPSLSNMFASMMFVSTTKPLHILVNVPLSSVPRVANMIRNCTRYEAQGWGLLPRLKIIITAQTGRRGGQLPSHGHLAGFTKHWYASLTTKSRAGSYGDM